MTLVREEIAAVVASDHPWSRRGSIPADDLPAEPFLTREAASGTRAVAEAALRQREIALRPTLELASTQSLKRSVLSGGFTLLSHIAVQDECEAGTLVARPVEDIDLRRALRAARVHDRLLGDPADLLWAYLATQTCDRSV